MSVKFEDILNEDVLRWMKNDIDRELWLAHETERKKAVGEDVGPYPGAGNLMCALALVCYTEFFGSFITAKKRGQGQTSRNFDAMFRRMRPPVYSNFLASHPRLADTLRNGLVHDYAIKGSSIVWMTSHFPNPRGVIEGSRANEWHFIVDAYAKDLFAAADDLYAELKIRPVIPS
jgi:hypothetical protein